MGRALRCISYEAAMLQPLATSSCRAARHRTRRLGGLFVTSCMLLAACATKTDGLPHGVTRAGIRSIAIGMTEGQVVSILGRPLKISTDAAPAVRTLWYGEPPSREYAYPMLWVHLKNGRVWQVYAKKYVLWGTDDEGVYSLDESGRTEGVEFEATFPK
jgi:hypothetical protein